MIDLAAVIDWAVTIVGVMATCAAFFIMYRMFVGGSRFQPLQKEASSACALGLFALGHVTRVGMRWTDLMIVFGASSILFLAGFRGTSERRADPNVI